MPRVVVRPLVGRGVDHYRLERGPRQDGRRKQKERHLRIEDVHGAHGAVGRVLLREVERLPFPAAYELAGGEALAVGQGGQRGVFRAADLLGARGEGSVERSGLLPAARVVAPCLPEHGVERFAVPPPPGMQGVAEELKRRDVVVREDEMRLMPFALRIDDPSPAPVAADPVPAHGKRPLAPLADGISLHAGDLRIEPVHEQEVFGRPVPVVVCSEGRGYGGLDLHALRAGRPDGEVGHRA